MTLAEKYMGAKQPEPPPADHVHKPENCWWCQNLREKLK